MVDGSGYVISDVEASIVGNSRLRRAAALWDSLMRRIPVGSKLNRVLLKKGLAEPIALLLYFYLARIHPFAGDSRKEATYVRTGSH